MNVRKKMKLYHIFESYWNMLPFEIKEIVWEYKEGQEAIDEKQKKRMKKLMKDLCDEIKKYGRLKRKWGIGHIKCIVGKGICRFCTWHHLKLMGCYEDEEGEREERFLGYNYRMALDRVDIVKSSL